MDLFLRSVIGHWWLEGHRLSVLRSLRVTLRPLPSPPLSCSWQAQPPFALFRATAQALLVLRKSGSVSKWRPWGETTAKGPGVCVGRGDAQRGGGNMLMVCSCWSVPRLGQPPGQRQSQPRVPVRERFRDTTPRPQVIQKPADREIQRKRKTQRGAPKIQGQRQRAKT